MEAKVTSAVVKRGGGGGGGDTKIFHCSMIQRHYINRITKLEDSQGNTLLDHGDIEEELVTYYKEILS
jgi:hypothetical protein